MNRLTECNRDPINGGVYYHLTREDGLEGLAGGYYDYPDMEDSCHHWFHSESDEVFSTLDQALDAWCKV